MAVQPFFFQGLTGGMDQATDPSLVENNESPLLRNMSLDQPGNWNTRLGTRLLGDVPVTSDSIWGLFHLYQVDGTRKLLKVTDRDLYLLDEGLGTWSAVDTNEWPATTKVDGVNFLNRLYLGSADGDTSLKYTTGGAVTAVTPKIGGSMLAVNKNILAVGGNLIKPEVIAFTDPFTDNFPATTGTVAANADVAGAGTITATTSVFEPEMVGGFFYNTDTAQWLLITAWQSGTVINVVGDTSAMDDNAFVVLRNVFKQDNACTGLIGFREMFVSFDERKMYMWDPTNDWSDENPRSGCVNYRTVKVVDGLLLWASRSGIWLWSGQGKPQDITSKFRNKVNGYGIWDLIDTTIWADACAHSFESEGIYELHLGTLKTLSGAPASALPNVSLVYDVKKGTGYLKTYARSPRIFTTFINSDGEELNLFGTNDTSAIYQMRTNHTDQDEDEALHAIAVDWRTAHHVLGDPRFMRSIEAYFVKYISRCHIEVGLSVNRQNPVDVVSLPPASEVTIYQINPKAETQGFSHSLKFSNQNVGAVTFTGSGLDDLTTNETYNGETDLSLVIQIDGTGTPDTFRWSKNGGSTWAATGVSITGSAQTLENGLTVTFAATTGHTLNNSWAFLAAPSDFVIEAYGFNAEDLRILDLPRI